MIRPGNYFRKKQDIQDGTPGRATMRLIGLGGVLCDVMASIVFQEVKVRYYRDTTRRYKR